LDARVIEVLDRQLGSLQHGVDVTLLHYCFTMMDQ
jgi:hypothetical protein